MIDESQANIISAKILKDGIERRKQKAPSELPASTGSAGLKLFTVLDLMTGKDRVFRTEQGASRFAWRTAHLSNDRSSVIFRGGKVWNVIKRPPPND